MKIVVLAGGLSTERAVSLVSGSGICRALRQRGHRAILLDIFLGMKEVPADLETLFDAPDGLCPDAKIEITAPDIDAVRRSRGDDGSCRIGPHVLEICAAADIVFLGLHGQDGEDGRIQATFDLMGIRYTGSGYLSSGLAMDKAMAKRIMDAAGIPTPKWEILHYQKEDVDRLAEQLPMPCVIKTTTGGSSLGVYLPEDREELKKALLDVMDFDGQILMEERIYGRELTVAVLGERALPAVEIQPCGKDFDYIAKYQAGSSRELCPAPITPQQQQQAGAMALKLHKALGLAVYSRTDLLMDEAGQLWCLEVNSLPGMTPTSLVPQEAAAVGMDYGTLCEEIVNLSYPLKRR